MVKAVVIDMLGRGEIMHSLHRHLMFMMLAGAAHHGEGAEGGGGG